jgi:hypothetical protein
MAVVMSVNCQERTHAPQQLFDHLVGAGEKRGWDGKADGLSNSERAFNPRSRRSLQSDPPISLTRGE